MRYLNSRRCCSNFEYSYLRPDENAIEREFSYDIDAAYIKDPCFVKLMMECKYRHESTAWFFLPNECDIAIEILPYDLLHPMDHFISIEFPRRIEAGDLGPLCSKGIEITPTDHNEKSITQAVCQLSYALAEQIASAITSQVSRFSEYSHMFFHVPVIVTTAQLYRLREGVCIESIKDATDFHEVADQLDCVVMSNMIGTHLRMHNRSVFGNMRKRLGDDLLRKHLCTFTDDLNHFFSVMESHYCPTAIAVINYSTAHKGLDMLFDYIDRWVLPVKGTDGQKTPEKNQSC